MKKISEFQKPIQFLFTDIDDTLTNEGQLGPQAYQALWSLNDAGIHVIPVTGRPAGWCEMMARQWPVQGVIGENGGFYFRYHQKVMKRDFFFDANTQAENRKKLDLLQKKILKEVPGCALASDQFCRLMDLAIDFCEDVPALTESSIQKIVDLFHHEGAIAKVSSIHVNGWFGKYDKLSMALRFLKQEFSVDEKHAVKVSAFVGDSPNDEPMFQFFSNSFAVANFRKYADQVKYPPTYIAELDGGLGFSEIADQILRYAEA